MDSWFQISLTVASDLSDAVSGIVYDLGSCGLQVVDDETRSQVHIKAYFGSSSNPQNVRVMLEERLDGLASTASPASLTDRKEVPRAIIDGVEDVPNEDWALSWRRFFEPVYPIPQMVVCPPWQLVPAPKDGIRIVVEPKRAFGTGRHESTRLALRALSEFVAKGDRVLDVGVGSGILSAAALKLGATRLVGVDLDPLAVENATETLLQNEPGGSYEIREGSARTVTGTFDVVVANITADVLGPMLRDLRERMESDGHLIMSGIVEWELPPLKEKIKAEGLCSVKEIQEAEWVSIVVCGGQEAVQEAGRKDDSR